MKTFYSVAVAIFLAGLLGSFAVMPAHASNPDVVRADQFLRTQGPWSCELPDDNARLLGLVTGNSPSVNEIYVAADLVGGMNTTPDTITTAGNMSVNPTSGIAEEVNQASGSSGLVVNRNPSDSTDTDLFALFDGSSAGIGNIMFVSSETPNTFAITWDGHSIWSNTSNAGQIVFADGVATFTTPTSGLNPITINEQNGGSLVINNPNSGQFANMIFNAPQTSGGSLAQIQFEDSGTAYQNIAVGISGSDHIMEFNNAHNGKTPLVIDYDEGQAGNITTGNLIVGGENAPALSTGGNGRIYFDVNTNQLYVSSNAGPYYPFLTGATGADVHLDNLSATAVNASIIPGTAGTINLGSGALPYNNIYFSGNVITSSGGFLVSNVWENQDQNGNLRWSTDTEVAPSADNTISLGDSTHRYNNFFLAGTETFGDSSSITGGAISDASSVEVMQYSHTIRELIDTSGHTSIDFQNRDLIDTTGSTTQLSWSTTGVTVPNNLTEQSGAIIATTSAQPTCTSANRGQQWIIQGASGVADIYQICEKNSSDAYVWVSH